MPVHKLSQIGSIGSTKIDYPSMLAGYGDYGAVQRIGYKTADGTASDYSFTNIPQIYQDLMLVVYARGAKAATTCTFLGYVGTGANGTNLLQSNENSTTILYGDGTNAQSTRTSNATGLVVTGGIPAASATSGIFASCVFHFLNYANTSTYKNVLMRTATDRNGAGNVNLQVGLMRTTSALQTVGVATYGDGNLVSGSTFALYGVKASNA